MTHGIGVRLYNGIRRPRAVAVGLVAVVLALGISGYWFREPISDSLVSAKDGLFKTFGLGVVPVGVWVLCAAAVALWRRHWFSRLNLWAGSVALVAFGLGVMGFFEPYRGALATFTLDGDVTLGGRVGGAIAGTAPWLGVIQLTAIAVAGAAMTSPSPARSVASRLGQMALFGYMFVAVSVTRMYRSEDRPPPRRRSSAGTRRAALPVPPSGISPSDQVKAISDSVLGTGPVGLGSDVTEPVSPSQRGAVSGVEDDPPKSGVQPIEVDDDRLPEYGVEDNPSDAHFEPSAPIGEEPAGSVLGKFNRFWTSSQSKGSERSGESPNGGATMGVADEDGDDSTSFAGDPARQWARPDLDLLETAPDTDISKEDMDATGQTKPGPTVTMYGLIPGWVRRHKQVRETDEDGRPKLNESGKPIIKRVETKTRVKVDNILSREKDLALALKTPSIRIETPAMGKSMVGIEVPNPHPSLVTLRSIMESDDFDRVRSKALLPIALGKGSGGENIVIDLAKMPHLLIAGATGSGKSVCINGIVSGLIMERSPAEMRLLLVDPKRVELTPYNGIPHLLTPVVVDTDKVVGLLKGLIQEMLDRYRRMEDVSVRNIEAYNKKMPEKMPLLVVAVDELADLMMSAAFDVEQSLCRLAQLGRATGIHLIVATQRPSVDVVTGLIKANFPSRVSFGVTSQVDSRTILDTAGADKLLGRGDMLYLPLDASKPVRAQGVFISDREIDGLVGFWKTTPRAAVPRVQLRPAEDTQTEGENAGRQDDVRDELLDKAIELAHTYSKLSTSLMQRRLRIGYPRAARLMDQLEEQGIVGPSDGSKSRDVIMNRA
jgi:S-DNA-T family DNA segregation ATPase FtsK/SpoIIIE